MKLVELGDFIEALNHEDIKVEYDDDDHISSCVVKMKGHAPLHFTEDTFAIVQPRPASPKALVESLFTAQLALTQTYKVLAIPFEAAPSPKIGGPSSP